MHLYQRADGWQAGRVPHCRRGSRRQPQAAHLVVPCTRTGPAACGWPLLDHPVRYGAVCRRTPTHATSIVVPAPYVLPSTPTHLPCPVPHQPLRVLRHRASRLLGVHQVGADDAAGAALKPPHHVQPAVGAGAGVGGGLAVQGLHNGARRVGHSSKEQRLKRPAPSAADPLGCHW